MFAVHAVIMSMGLVKFCIYYPAETKMLLVYRLGFQGPCFDLMPESKRCRVITVMINALTMLG